MFRFLKITMLDCVYVRATSTERRYIACTGLKFIFITVLIWLFYMGKAVTISPNSSKLTPQTVRRSGYKFRERQPPCIKQALIGHKKARYLFEPITETHRTAPAVLTLTGANVGIKF